MVSQELQRVVEGLIERVVEALTPYAPEKVILFGSSARGDFDEASDLDILVYTPEEFEQMIQEGRGFILRVLEEGKVLYEKRSDG